MLTVLRRVFSFRDWYTNHPNEPPPGDMLDASFDAQDSKISEIAALVESVRRPDGALQNGIVTRDSLDPDTYGDLRHEMRLAAHFELKRAQEQVELAREAAESALSAQKRAEISEISSRADAATINSAKSDQMRQINALIAESRAISAELRSAEAQLADTEDYVGYSEAWAESSRLWAEHMPDTLPDNALKGMDITGDHWSSRWWAHKAAGAFGALSELYLGAHPVPPSSTSTGEPIPIGGIYYNTETGMMYVWDGSQWVSMTQPQRAGLAALWYNAAEGQTAFPFAVMDLNGRNYALSIDATEGVDAHVNGVKLMPKEGPSEGDWTLNNSTSTVTFLRPLRAGDIVSFDILMANEKLGPGEVYAWSLALTEAQDGTRTTFTLDTKDAGGPNVTVNKNEELLVSLDGVVQEPAVSYSASGSSITFAQPPNADVRIFITWFRTGAA